MARTETQKANLEDRIRRRELTNNKNKTRRDDARMKIIAGALALEHFTQNPQSEFARVMFNLLNEYTREHERHLFDFLPDGKPS